jgi:predicted transcriptional regulator
MSTGKTEVTIACRVPSAMRSQLIALASREDRTVSWLLRKAAKRLLAAEAKKSKRQTAEPSELQ